MATRIIKKLDSKTFLFNADAKAVGYKCIAVGDFVTLDGAALDSGDLFNNAHYTSIAVQEADGTKIIDGSDSGVKVQDIVKAINNIVNFSGGDGVGALLIAKKLDGKDAVFSDLNALKAYYTTNPTALPNSNSAAIVGTANPDGTVATITIAYVWDDNTKTWNAVATNFKGDKGDKGDAGDETNLIDDTQALATKTYSSNKIENQLVQLIKMYGANGRVRFDTNNKHFYFEILDNGNWIQKAEIGSSIIIDAVRFIKGDKPQNINANEIAEYLREITLPDGTISIRPEIVLPNGDEYGFVYNDQQTDRVVYRLNNGELHHIIHRYIDKNDIQYDNLDEIKFGDRFKLSVTQINGINRLLIDVDDGYVPPVVTPFTVYYGFYHLDTIQQSAVLNLTTRDVTSVIGDYPGTQNNPPNYFYIIVPKDKSRSITSIAQLPSSLGTVWTTAELNVNGTTYTSFRSPNRMYDQTVRFKTL